MSEETKHLNIGLVMPIAPIDNCSQKHWEDVKHIIIEAVSSMPGYHSEPRIVSEGESSGLIHKRIVEGLYEADIVICDVSCKNPNVMFELGMRLAFDKPTIIIKDDQTGYSFDTGVIEHLQYPRDLRYSDITEFKRRLANKVISTFEDSQKDPNHSPFLKSFGTFKIATIQENEVTANEFVIRSIKEMQNDLSELKLITSTSRSKKSVKYHELSKDENFNKLFFNVLDETIGEIAKDNPGIKVPVENLLEVVIPFFKKIGRNINEIEVRELIINYLNENGIPYV